MDVLKTLFFLLACFVLITLGNGEKPDPKRLLVLLNDLKYQKSHSKFIANLKERGYTMHIKEIGDDSLSLHDEDDAWLYEQIVIFGSSKGMYL
jgi:hypothetical protein